MLRQDEVFAGYRIERQLGHGGMGSVYLAQHPRLPRRTALKLLNRELFADSAIRARFEREADLVAGLDHSNIVTVYDRGVEGDQPWISMQYVDGVDASTVDPARLPPQRAVRIVAEVAAALDYAHRRGVLHRDVKPANMLLERATDGAEERVLLTDFGIARLRDDRAQLTQTGTVTATLMYASPEQLSSAELDQRTDQYSLACSLFWLLTGSGPYRGDNPGAIVAGHLQGTPPSLRGIRPDLPPAIDAVLARALAKRPEDRFGSCGEFAAAVQQAIVQPWTPPQSVPTVPLPDDVVAPVDLSSATTVAHQQLPMAAPRKRRPTPVLAGAILAAVLLVTVVLIVVQTNLSGSDGGSASAGAGTSSPAPTSFGDPADPESISRAFPKLVLAGSGTEREGYNRSKCSLDTGGYRHGPSTGPDFESWITVWSCIGRTSDDPDYNIYAFASARSVQDLVASLPSNERIATKNGKPYVSYRWTAEGVAGYGAADNIVTTFEADSPRAQYVVFSHNFRRSGVGASQDEFAAWWQALPLD